MSSDDCTEYRVVVHTVHFYDVLICQSAIRLENLVFQDVRMHKIFRTVLYKSDFNRTLTTPTLSVCVMRPLLLGLRVRTPPTNEYLSLVSGVCRQGALRRADHLSRGDLLVWSVRVSESSLENDEAVVHEGCRTMRKKRMNL